MGLAVAEARVAHDLGNRSAGLAGGGVDDRLGQRTACRHDRGRQIAWGDLIDQIDLQQACPMTNARWKQRQQGDEWV